ncbi:Sister chromatid cohesion protein 2 [Coemansia helicoidea]|uniref:Sister chromatid cohesion protein 2 n=1 Tax=Coemansia helicoidea TaxID=1286919 RepID=A0ACC1LHQ2_9FUNG|nr:Sister chromatid cohesion protein 2 [Coemansia helicoidea]
MPRPRMGAGADEASEACTAEESTLTEENVDLAPAESDSRAPELVRGIEHLEDFLAEVFAKEDELRAGDDGHSSLLEKVPGDSNSLVLSRPAARRARALLAACPRACISTQVEGERVGRLIGLLVAAIDAAKAAGLAAMICDGARVVRGEGLADGYCSALSKAMLVSSLGLEAAALAFDMVAEGRALQVPSVAELLRDAAALLKEVLLDCLVPLLDTAAEGELICAVTDAEQPLHGRLRTLLEAALAAGGAVSVLAAQNALREEDTVPLVYVSISVLFCSGEALKRETDANLFESLRRSSQALLRGVFELHADQRAWILEEVLASLVKLPAQKRAQSAYRVVGGRAVQFASVLLLQLLQATAHSPEDLTAGLEGGGLSVKECRLLLQRYRRAVAAASSSADFAIRYLIGRCAKRENRVAANESEYRALLETLVNDCLALLGHPQWPAAELVVRIYSLHILEILEEDKSDIAVRSMALEAAAQIASHIAQAMPAPKSGPDGGSGRLEPISTSTSPEAIGRFHTVTASILGYLQSRAASGESTGATPFHVGGWASSLLAVLLKCVSSMERGGDSAAGTIHDNNNDGGSDDDDSGSESDDSSASSAGSRDHGRDDGGCNAQRRQAIEACLRGYASIAHQSTKTMTGAVSHAAAAEAARTVLVLQPLFRSFDMLLARVTLALGAGQVSLRSRALRALNQIAQHRPRVLYQPSVKFAINHRLQDSSPLVREAAIDLLGKHIAHNPELTDEYYEFISVRILDKGPSVRKRVMRILADVYATSENTEQLVDIGVRLLQRASDEERAIRELALKTLQDLWFTDQLRQHASDGGPTAETPGNVFNSLPPDSQREVLKRVRVMTGVMDATRARDNADLMAGLFRHACTGPGRADNDEALFVVRCMIDALFEQLLRAEESALGAARPGGDGSDTAPPEFAAAACLRFIATLSAIAPDAVAMRAQSLSGYLRLDGAADEGALLDVLAIFNNTLLKIPHPGAAFLGALEGDLIRLLSSSPQSVLTVAVPCLCTLVDRLTRNYAKLVRLFRSCVLQLYREQQAVGSGAASTMSPKNLMRFIILAGLTSRHFDFDQCRERHGEYFRELDQIAGGSMLDLMSRLLLFFAAAQRPTPVQLAAMHMLGQLHIRRPRLALELPARAVMDRAFAEGSAGHKLQVLRNFLEFLRTDTERAAAQDQDGRAAEREVDAKALIGDVGDVGEAGVGASLMQMYLDRIIEAMFGSRSAALRAAGFEVVSLVLEQGLAHPLKCMPALIALGTSNDAYTRTKAWRLYQELSFKYASFIHSRDLEGVRRAYEYQLLVHGDAGAVEGYDTSADAQEQPGRPAARLQFVYSQARSRRRQRNELLTLLVKACDGDPSSAAGPGGADIPFVRFVAENLSAFEFRHLDEVLHVVYQLSSVIASTGVNLHHQLDAEAGGASSADDDAGGQQRQATEQSVCICILLELREFLMAHYGVTEARCASYSPADAAGARDKAAQWHAQGGGGRIDWSRCPAAARGMAAAADYAGQRALFRRRMAASLAADDGSDGPGGPDEG